jgi:glycosyltransferase involved in cell wall biosynthesis
MSSWYPTKLDPYVGNFVQRFAELLTQEYDVSVIHTMGDATATQIEVIDEVINHVRTVVVYHPVATNKFNHWWIQRKALRKALHLIEDVDLLFAHVLVPRGLQFVKAKFYYHCPMVVMEHASYFSKNLNKRLSPIQKTIIKRTSLHIKQVIAVSEVLKRDMKSLFPTTKIQVIPNFVDSHFFPATVNKTQYRTKFIHISTLDPETKNPQLLVDGFKLALESGQNDLSLTIVSDQPMDHWKNWVIENGLEAQIRFVGPLNWEEIGRELQQHDALVVTSKYETFSIVIAEAWLAGLPIIATRVGIADSLDPALGISIEHTPISLKDALIELSNGSHYFASDVIRNHAQQYTETPVLAQLTQTFERYFDHHD